MKLILINGCFFVKPDQGIFPLFFLRFLNKKTAVNRCFRLLNKNKILHNKKFSVPLHPIL